MKLLYNILLLFLISILWPTTIHAQYEFELIEEESQLWIEGSSTVSDIYCKAGEIVGYANIESTSVNPNELADTTDERNGNVRINIPVWEFDCGKRKMNRDFYKALKAEDYPSIEFRYHSARLVTNLDPECAPFQLEVEGVLSVAGVGKEVTIMVDIEPCELNRFRLKGSKVINMKDFGIDPPSALFGLIRAHEELEVFFSLTGEHKASQK